MTLLAESANTSVARRRPLSKLGYAYAVLGLRAGEARVDTIRQAAAESAESLKQLSQTRDERDQSLAEVAASAYRLLDPRQRAKRIERIQLCILSERSIALQQCSRRPLAPLSR